MGQVVSYLLRCICGKAEEEEKLKTCPLKSNSSNKSRIDSSSANSFAKHQFMFNHTTIQVSDETTQMGNTRSDSNNISQALQPDHILLVSPPSPTLFPSIDPSTTESLLHDPFYSSAPPTVFPSIGSSSTGGTLLDEVFVDTSTDFPSISSSTDEKLPHGFFVLSPTFFPNTNLSSTGRTLFHEAFGDPPTDVASVDLSTDEALLHHELFVAPPTYVPSLDMGNDQALLNKLFVDPSTYVPSIGCSTDETLLPEFTTTPSAVFRSIDQFKVTDSNIQVVEDKMQVHPPNNENVKTTKERSEEESKEAKTRKGASVVIERKIKHYSSSQKILLVGEGDFSFSACLGRTFGSASNIVATSLDSTGERRRKKKGRVQWVLEEEEEEEEDQWVLEEEEEEEEEDQWVLEEEEEDQWFLEEEERRKEGFNGFLKKKKKKKKKKRKEEDQWVLEEEEEEEEEDDQWFLEEEEEEDKWVLEEEEEEDQWVLEEEEDQWVLEEEEEEGEEEDQWVLEEEEAALPVVIERTIKHYSSSQKILLVGEGDFSFSACLARAFGSASNIVATSLDSTEFLRANYKNAMSNICELRIRGGNVMHGVDATEMACNCLINDSVYDRIIYNFPHDGFFQNESRKMQLKRHRGLVFKFFENAMELIPEDGEIHISHKSNGFFLEWNLQLLASNAGLRLIEEVPFDLKDYKGYKTKYGFGGAKNFDCNPSKTYKFGFKTRKTAI